MINELISRVFALRDCAHLTHWSTKSYAEHEALGDFYEALIDKIDGIIETHQGISGLVKGVKLQHYSKPTLQCMMDDLLWINENADKISQNISPLRNMLDDLMALYASTIYKLENLK